MQHSPIQLYPTQTPESHTILVGLLEKGQPHCNLEYDNRICRYPVPFFQLALGMNGLVWCLQIHRHTESIPTISQHFHPDDFCTRNLTKTRKHNETLFLPFLKPGNITL